MVTVIEGVLIGVGPAAAIIAIVSTALDAGSHSKSLAPYPRECMQLREHIYEIAPGKFRTDTECDRYK
jgi:hypothetical protein